MSNETVGIFKIEASFFTKISNQNKIRVPLKIFIILGIYGLAATTSIKIGGVTWPFFVSPFLGFVLAGFVNASHDCVHNNHLTSRKQNRVMGAIWCTPILINYSIYRYKHLVHHRLTGREGDTEPSIVFCTLFSYLRSLSGFRAWPNILKGIIKIFKNVFPKYIDSEQRISEVKRDNIIIVFWFLSMVIATFFFPKIILFGYWLPLLCFPPMLFIFSLPEHYACRRGDLDVRTNTRSIRANHLVHFFQWNANFHAEHHAYPSIPATHLQRLSEKISGQIQNSQNSYFLFHFQILKNFMIAGDSRDEEQKIRC